MLAREVCDGLKNFVGGVSTADKISHHTSLQVFRGKAKLSFVNLCLQSFCECVCVHV